ncbi:pentapeptide repeat-containing protein [Actinomadura rudentiformis]|uniref:pentapeptide repeat-containing protein n=1 Tax=Actinomadura rudentiformis TaxID=359158 RepID=UPI00178C763D|nr:pentapeptide repeat-containing protein [Actinomadura rudentiformis]
MVDWDLTEPEQRLWEAFPSGEWVDLRSGDTERAVRGEVLTALLLGAAGDEPGRRPAVRVRGAVVTGRLDLMGSTAVCPLVCEHCHFENPLRFVEATTGTVRLVDCEMPSVNAARLNARGIVNLHRSRVDGGLRFDRATIAGDIVLIGTEVGADAEGVALAAEGLVVDGNCSKTRRSLTAISPGVR